MGIGDSLRDAYYSLEDKWYSFIDGVSEKVPAVGSFVDALEDKGIPSFPAFILLIIIIVALLAFFFLSSSQATLTIKITDDTGTGVEGASVIVLQDDVEIANVTTKENGLAVFLLPRGEYSLKVDKENYSTSTKSITLDGDKEEDLTLSLEDTTITKAVYLKTANGELVSGSGTVIYRCRGDTGDQTATYASGKFDATVKKSCAAVEVITIQNYNLVEPIASFSGNSAVTVEQIVVLTGRVTVSLSIAGSTDLPPAGVRVQLVPNDNTTSISAITQGGAVVVFEEVPVKSYYVLVTDPNGAFSVFDGSKLNETKNVLKGETTQFTAALARVQATKIIVNVKDSATGLPVKGAEIKLTSAANTNDVLTKITGALGQGEFSVAQGSNYVVTVDHPDYVSGKTMPAAAGETINFQVEKVDSSNSNTLTVQVVDSKDKPVDYARVVLKKIEANEPIVGEKITGASGEAQFFNLEVGKSYIASISKEGFGSQTSPSVQIEPKSGKTVKVTFDIGYGKVLVKVLDPEKAVLAGISVKAFNSLTTKQEGEALLTGSDGIAEFSEIRADKKVFFIIESSAYAKYFTATVQPTANAELGKEVVLMRPTGKLLAEPVIIFSGTEEMKNGAGSEVGVSQGIYTLKAILQVPKGQFSEAGMHIRTGKQTQNLTNNLEEDGLYISTIEASGRITKGTSYTPPTGYDIDSKNTTQGNAKWANIVWKNPAEGTYEVEAEVSVTETNPNVPLELFYRGWAKGSATLRDPASNVAGNELYSIAKRKILSVGSASMCTASFCKSYILTPLTGSEAGRARIVSGTVEAKKGVTYSLTADLTNYSGKTISGAALSVEGKSVDINSITINDVPQTDLASSINLGNIGADSPVKIVVTFTTKTSGSSGVRFIINSSTKNEFDELIAINVKVNKKFLLSIVPKIIIPYINNTMFFEATDGNNSLSGVLIQIKNGKNTLGKVETSGEGLATYELSEPKLDDEITFIASKEGYDNVEVTKKVDAALLTITPQSISETIKIGDVTGLTTTVIMQNNTSKNVRLGSVQINGDMKTYIDAKFIETLAGTIIEQGKDKNFTLSLKLNSSAIKLKAPKDLTGTVVINTEIPGTSAGYLNEIPISIRLSMPGYMDDAKCLKVTPATIDFITSDTEESKTVVLSNLCTAEDFQIPLHDISAKLNEAMKVGTISVNGSGFATVNLGDKYVKIADSLEKDSETELTIRFSPNSAVSSGKQTVTVTIMGKNILDDKTEEKVETTLKVNSTMNSLSKCIEIVEPSGGILLDIAPWNLGYNRIQQSNMSAYAGGYQGFTNRSAPYNMSYMGGMGMMGYGTNGYGSAYGGFNSYGMYPGSVAGGGMQNMSYQQNSFIIKNNCQTDVDIDLDPDSRVTVSTDKFTLSANSDETVTVDPGYVLGKYKIKINAKPKGTTTSMKNLKEVSVTIRRLGDMDTDCIKTNVTTINLNSFLYRPQKYSVFNYCYDTGAALSRSNVASIECSAPQNNSLGLNYFQQGQESYYGSSYPLNGQNATYNSYIQPSGCQTNSCSLITGTRVRQRTTEQGTTGTIERVDFDVMPSSQYIPQQKLFDNKVGKYGAFQNLSAIRSWATETDARTNVYGNLNISYTNQYGSAECMEFPITITDVWRMGESIDSAINWGDPTARPKDCQEADALNITKYWENKTPNKDGVVPDSGDGFNAQDRYVYMAEPPALKIGPSPTQNSMSYPSSYGNNMYAYMNPQYGMYNNQQGAQYYSSGNESYMRGQPANNGNSGSATKNCGLLDGIDVKTVINPKDAGGAKVTVTDRGTGSIINNSRGSNLMVEIDRSTMTVNCVHLNIPITAKVTRSINFESQDLTWFLDVKFAKKGIPYNEAECMKTTTSTVTDCKDALRSILLKNNTKQNDAAGIEAAIKELLDKRPECRQYVDVSVANTILGQIAQDTNLGKGCALSPAEFGHTLIKSTKSTPADTVDCTQYFCSGEMLNLFLLKKFSEARTMLNNELSDLRSPLEIEKKSKVAKYDAAKDVMISRLYRRAIERDINICNSGAKAFYSIEGTKALDIYGKYELSNLKVDSAAKKIITDKGAGAVPLTNMVTYVLGASDLKKDYNSLLIKVPVNPDVNKGLEGIGFVVSGSDYYLSLETYSDLLTQVAKDLDNAKTCDKANTACKITLCGRNDVVLEPNVIKYINDFGQLVKGVYDREDMDQIDIEAIYSKNPKLNKVHDLAKFNSVLSNTKIGSSKLNSGLAPSVLLAKTTLPANGFDAKAILNNSLGDLGQLKIAYSGENNPKIGRYSLELDYAYVGTEVSKEAKATLSDHNSTIEGAPKVQNNALLLYGLSENDLFVVNSTDAIFTSPARNTIIGERTIGLAGQMAFFKKIPLKVSARLYAGESGLMYKPVTGQTSVPSLINWYASAQAPKGPDSLVQAGNETWYNINIIKSNETQSIYGIYYYPDGGALFVNRGTAKGGEITLTKAGYMLNIPISTVPLTIPGADSQRKELSAVVSANTMTLDGLLPEINEGRACYSDDGTLNWNESKLIKGAN